MEEEPVSENVEELMVPIRHEDGKAHMVPLSGLAKVASSEYLLGMQAMYSKVLVNAEAHPDPSDPRHGYMIEWVKDVLGAIEDALPDALSQPNPVCIGCEVEDYLSHDS